MKKSIIAAGAASVALAAMPIVSTFAITTVKDDVTATVQSGCTVSNEADSNGDGTYATNAVVINVAPGQSSTSSAGTPSAGISIVCNGTSWHISAVGSTSTANEHLNNSLYNGDIAIPTGTSGDSYWAFKLPASVEGMATASGYTDWHAIPNSATTVITGTASKTTTIVPEYKVSVASNVVAGSYVGQVTYTVATGAGN